MRKGQSIAPIKRKMILGIALAVVLGLAATLVAWAPTETERVQNTIERFVGAYNAGNGQAMLSYVDPQWAQVVREQITQAGNQLGLDETLMWRFMPLLYQWMQIPEYHSMGVAIESIAIEGTIATASAIATIQVASVTQKFPCTITLQKTQRRWHLTSIHLR